MAVVGVGVAPVGVGFGGATPPKGRVLGVPSGGSDGTPGDQHWGGMQAGYPGIRAVPGVPPGWMASVSAAKVPQSRRAGAHRAAGGFAADLPRRADVVREFSGGERAYRRQKSVPDRAPRWKQTSEPGYHPHRLRYGTEIPLTRYLLRGAGSPPLHPTSSTDLGRVCSSDWRSASLPRSRKTSDLPPGIGISIGPSIPTSTKQQNNKTTQHIREA